MHKRELMTTIRISRKNADQINKITRSNGYKSADTLIKKWLSIHSQLEQYSKLHKLKEFDHNPETLMLFLCQLHFESLVHDLRYARKLLPEKMADDLELPETDEIDDYLDKKVSEAGLID